MKKVTAILTREHPDHFSGGKWYYTTQTGEVRVMAVAEGYAMVRFKGCLPFVVSEKQLVFPDAKP